MSEGKEKRNPKIEIVKVAGTGDLNDNKTRFNLPSGEKVAIGRNPDPNDPDLVGIPEGARLVGFESDSIREQKDLTRVPRFAAVMENLGKGDDGHLHFKITCPEGSNRRLCVYDMGYLGSDGRTLRRILEPGHRIVTRDNPIIDTIGSNDDTLVRFNVAGTFGQDGKVVRVEGSSVAEPID